MNNSLDRLITRAEKNTLPSGKDEILVVFDPEARTTFLSKNSGGWFRKLEYYLVKNSKDGYFVQHSTSEIDIHDFATDRRLPIVIKSKIGCPEGQEEKLVLALAHKTLASGLVLQDYERGWVDAMSALDSGQFLDRFLATGLVELLKTIKVNGLRIGIDFQEIRCELPKAPTTIRLELSGLSATFKDSTEKRTFHLEVNLDVDKKRLINALSTFQRQSDLELLVKNSVVSFLQTEIEFEVFVSSRLQVQDSFRTYLDQRLAKFGRKAGAVLIKDDEVAEKAPRMIDKRLTVSIDVPEFPKPVPVACQIQIERENIAISRANGPENLDEWLLNQYTDAVKRAFFGLKYYEIYVEFEAIKGSIKSRLSELLKTVGYKLEHIIVVPSFQGLSDLENIEVRVDDRFVTADQERVKLKVIAEVGINDFSNIRGFVDKGDLDELVKKIEKTFLTEIDHLVRSLESNDFYKNFLARGDLDENLSVKKRLHENLQSELVERFGAELRSIRFDIGETEILDKINSLKAKWHRFNVMIESRLGDRRTTEISGSFKVVSHLVTSWPVFQYQAIGIEDITNNISNALISELHTADSNIIAFLSVEDRSKFDSHIINLIEKSVESAFGLKIEVRHIETRAVDQTGKILEMSAKANAAITERIFDMIEAGIDATEEVKKLKLADAIKKGILQDQETKLKEAATRFFPRQRKELSAQDERSMEPNIDPADDPENQSEQI
jgi:hypothetical protein